MRSLKERCQHASTSHSDCQMDKALLGTDIFSEIMRGINPGVVARATAYLAHFGRFTMSTLTVVEVVKGHQRQQRMDRIQQFRALLPTAEVLTLEVGSADLAGRMTGDLERTGQPIGRM